MPPRARRTAAGRVALLLAPRPERIPPARASAVTVAGEIGRASGLGEGARLMAGAIASLGIPVATREAGLVPGGDRHELDATQAGGEQPGSLLVLHVNPPDLPASLLRLGRAGVRQRRVVGYWAWELAVAPDAWRAPARLVHEAWVPSRFAARALEPLLPGRVHVVPHPLASEPPRPSARGRADFSLPDDAVVVLVSFSLASSFERKNPLAAIAAFTSAFGTRADRHLHLKVGKPGHFPADMRRLRQAVASHPNITIETRTFAAADNAALTRAADIVLSLHRSEGFGLVPAEAMMLRRPVIATDWSATAEFLDADCAVPIPCRLIPVRDRRLVYDVPGAQWADPDHDASVEALRRLADDPTLRLRLANAAADRAGTLFTAAPLKAALARAGVQ